ncbi:Zn-dependent hydrolase [Ureibacillus acetophenoni]|uniref:Allantoate deiminase n=1 Tax=Ureibacillus acetophenoni TaxID=614649 RepID=A0A285UHY7_9BACL|nr:Zn-dependent hydrolase [Ureibacillus acetophenoni]SOC41422.1 allantoate deiminase [Ureibacillus acetophenoni]
MINRERLAKHIEELSQFGMQSSGGINRFSFTEEEAKANEYIEKLMEEAGLSVSFDAVGNVIGERQGTEEKAPIMIGSHIDTVPHGGKFDGALGVLAAIEVAQSLKDQGIQLKSPLKIVSFKDEEGTRFGFGLLGSRAMTGILKEEELEGRDDQGITLKEAMTQNGYDPEKIGEAKVREVAAYLELHIEQGKVLESENVPVGIVTGIAGPSWKEITVRGLSEHAGATPMPIRQDALVAASEMILNIEQIAFKYKDAVATVGKLQVKPNGVNVIPGEVTFSLDVRDLDNERCAKIVNEISEMIQEVSQKRNVESEIVELQTVSSVQADAAMQATIKEAVVSKGIKPISLVSGAGHDAMNLARICPMGMIFVRSKDGISHNPLEYSSIDDCEIATNVLFDTLVRLDQSI